MRKSGPGRPVVMLKPGGRSAVNGRAAMARASSTVGAAAAASAADADETVEAGAAVVGLGAADGRGEITSGAPDARGMGSGAKVDALAVEGLAVEGLADGPVFGAAEAAGWRAGADVADEAAGVRVAGAGVAVAGVGCGAARASATGSRGRGAGAAMDVAGAFVGAVLDTGAATTGAGAETAGGALFRLRVRALSLDWPVAWRAGAVWARTGVAASRARPATDASRR